MAERKSILTRFAIIYFLIVLFLRRHLQNGGYQYFEKDEWMELSEKLKRQGREIAPNRGNIFACDGQLMASTVPYYHLYMDTCGIFAHKNGANYKRYRFVGLLSFSKIR